ncbi:polyisoprenyl-teichoic acid--peptidoglycan teichoic acid transferase TagU [Cytobacillus sp. FSL H8-0458]|uniref:polyisoprenyl-teichoic acid--peptidoglycan teichoic acid transferase TagU n=1 Tax=Cytobacillus sp. FSL H8-0458 TaxID=2975346 RepID=UPI0030F98234
MGSRIKENSNKKNRKWLKIFISLFVVLFLSVGAYVYTVYNSLTNAVETMHQPIERQKSEKRTEEVTFQKKDPFSVLLLGVDEREGDRGRSDTMIVMTVNPNKESVQMVSIPRDTRTEIIGKGFEDKINHAYAFGGVEMSMDTVENLLDIPIDYYIQINMEGFKDIVDAVGGVTVENDMDLTFKNYYFPEGTLNLDGDNALIYSRIRKEDPRGDFGRQKRQREVIQAVINKGASFSSLTKFDDVFGALGNNVKTNLTFNEMISIQKNYANARKNISQSQVKGTGTKIDGIYYFLVPKEELSTLQTTLKENLEI